MGLSAWQYANHSRPPFQARPLPLLNGTEIVEQPTNLATISQRYTEAALEFVGMATAASMPFFLYIPFNHVPHRDIQVFHGPIKSCIGCQLFFWYWGLGLRNYVLGQVHNPNFASVSFCNTSERGPVGDAAQELDHSIGAITAGIAAKGLDESVVYFFTRWDLS
jgi:arylsulfatase A